MIKRLGVVLCLFAWSLQLSIFISPIVRKQANPAVFCQLLEHISSLDVHHHSAVSHTQTSQHHAFHHCLVCVVYAHVFFFSDMPSWNPVIWQSSCIILFFLAFQPVLFLLCKYIRPLSHAPPDLKLIRMV